MRTRGIERIRFTADNFAFVVVRASGDKRQDVLRIGCVLVRVDEIARENIDSFNIEQLRNW